MQFPLHLLCHVLGLLHQTVPVPTSKCRNQWSVQDMYYCTTFNNSISVKKLPSILVCIPVTLLVKRHPKFILILEKFLFSLQRYEQNRSFSQILDHKHTRML